MDMHIIQLHIFWFCQNAHLSLQIERNILHASAFAVYAIYKYFIYSPESIENFL